jgi:hypothetical protein
VRRRIEFALAASIVALGFALRAYRVGSAELWLDESASWLIATRHDWGRLFTRLTPPPFHLLLGLWARFDGESESGLRLLTVLAGTACVVAAVWAGRELGGSRCGLFAGLLAAVAPMSVYYSRELRPYVFLLLALMACWAALWRAMRVGTRAAWALLTILFAASLITHAYAVLGIVMVALAGLVETRARARVVVALVPGLALFGLWLSGLLLGRRDAFDAAEWIATTWAGGRVPLDFPLWGLEPLTYGGGKPLGNMAARGFATPLPWGLRLLGLLGLAAAGLMALLPERGQRVLPRRAAMLAAGAVGPLVVLTLASQVKPVFAAGRHDLVSLPPLLLLLALGLARGAARLHAAVVALVASALLVPMAARLAAHYAARDPARFSTGALALLDRVEDGALVIFTRLRGAPTLFQLAKHGYRWEDGDCVGPARRFACRMFPIETEASPGTFHARRLGASPDAVRDDLDAYLGSAGGAPLAVYVVLGDWLRRGSEIHVPTEEGRLMDALVERGYQPGARLPGLGIVTYRRRFR